MISNAWNNQTNAIVRYFDANLRGASQVFFQNNPLSGALILAAIFWGAHAAGNLNVAFGAVAGLFAGTSIAYLLDLDRASIKQGLFGFNGILVGVAVPTFLAHHAMMWVYLILGAAVSTIVTLAIDKVVKTWGVPGSTAPFVVTTWLLLLGAYALTSIPVTAMVPPTLPVEAGAGSMHLSSHMLLSILGKNVSQVYLIENVLTGVLFVIAIAISSVRGAGLAIIGSIVGLGAALVFGAGAAPITAGLYGFNAVLTVMAVETVFEESALRGVLYAILAAIFSVVVQAALGTALSPVGIPTLTFPYVLTMWLFVLPKADLAPYPHRLPVLTGVMAKKRAQ